MKVGSFDVGGRASDYFTAGEFYVRVGAQWVVFTIDEIDNPVIRNVAGFGAQSLTQDDVEWFFRMLVNDDTGFSPASTTFSLVKPEGFAEFKVPEMARRVGTTEVAVFRHDAIQELVRSIVIDAQIEQLSTASEEEITDDIDPSFRDDLRVLGFCVDIGECVPSREKYGEYLADRARFIRMFEHIDSKFGGKWYALKKAE